jgi:cholesterol oxidase
MRESTMPDISPRLGYLTRTNSEAILGVLVDKPETDLTQGVAITSSWHPDEHTHIEPVRYAKGSNAMGLLQAPLTQGGTRAHRLAQVLRLLLTKPWIFLKLVPRRWSERVLILLVMQSLNNSITVVRRTTKFGRRKMTSTQGQGEPNPTWIPVANEAAEKLADTVGGMAGGTWGDILNIPMTAHFIGGCAIGDSRDSGVIDAYHRIWGYEDAYVVDGAALSANLGVNPSLSITAQAERAASLWPNKGEVDLRPSQDEPYRRLSPIAPREPAVPEHAPAALRPVPLGLPTRRTA